MLRFRRGAFESLKPVDPIATRYHWNRVNFDTHVDDDLLPILFAECTINRLDVSHLPTFKPNDYLFNEYAKTLEGYEKMERWEIYASAVNEIIRTEGGYTVHNQAIREKLAYLSFMKGEIDELKINGETFYN